MLCGVGVVLYNPDIDRLKQSLDAVIKQVNVVVLVDNGSANIEQVCLLTSRYKGIKLISNCENLGIAKALNQIFEMALNLGLEWVMTLDQDTILSKNIIKKFKGICRNKFIGIVCPSVVYEGWSNFSSARKHYEEISACMTSGSFTCVEAWARVGGFEESYFIDHVDNEFCMKLKIYGYRIVRDNYSVMSHQLGVSKELNLFGKRIRYSKHSPVRCYYMVRNNLRFIKQYRQYLNLPKEYCKLIYVTIMNLICCDRFRETQKMIRKGIKDYRLNISGKFK